MSYYQALGLSREPFSNSPDPDLLYRARTHLECLQHMEIAVRLRRGLNVVLGEVGTGKTTLGRELTRLLAADGDIEVHFLDDPYQPTPVEFLMALARLFGLDPAPLGRDAGLLRDALKGELLRRGEGGRIVALIVDEGQKITGECLELLRELLNFETNTHKLLQIVIFAQTEFEALLAARPNLDDRVNFRYRLLTLDRGQTRRMIETRLALCAPDGQVPAVFSPLALRRIHRLTRGYPRKIVRLCHLSMLLAVGFGKRRIGWGLVGRAARESRGAAGVWLRRTTIAGACVAAALVGLISYGPDLPGARQAALGILGQATAYLESRPAAPTTDENPPAVSEPQDLADTAQAPVQSEGTPASWALRAEIVARPTAASAALSPTAKGEPDSPNPAEPQAVAANEPFVTDRSAVTTPQQGLGAALDLATAALPPDAPEQVLIITAEDVAPAATALPAPGQIGKSVVRPGWTVSRLAAKLYGSGGRRVLSRLAKANPGVDFNKVRAGESIVYPTIEASAPPAGSYLVKVAGVQTLEQGFAYIARQKEMHDLVLSLYCTDHPETGLRFDVVLPDVYPNQGAAVAALTALPEDVAGRAALVGGYPSGTIFFTEFGEGVSKRPGGVPVPVRQVAERQAAPGQPSTSARP